MKHKKFWLGFGGLGLTAVLAISYVKANRNWLNDQPYRAIMWETTPKGERVVSVAWYPQANAVEVVVIPADRRITSALGYGIFRLDKLDDLDQQEGLKGDLVKKTISQNLGMYYRGLATTETKTETGPDKTWVLKRWRQYVRTQTNLIDGVEALMVYRYLSDLPKDRIEVVDLTGEAVWMEGQSQGEERFFDPERFDQEVTLRRGEMSDILQISITNMSGKQGLAQALARILEREGFRVITAGPVKSESQSDNVSRLEIGKSEILQKEWVTRIQRLTEIEQIAEVDSVSPDQLNIILGGDFRGF